MKELEQQQRFSKNSHYNLELSPKMLKLELVKDIVILSICVIQNHNRSINEGTKAIMFFLK